MCLSKDRTRLREGAIWISKEEQSRQKNSKRRCPVEMEAGVRPCLAHSRNSKVNVAGVE